MSLYQLKALGARLVSVFSVVAVAADDGGDYLGFAVEGRVKAHSGADYALAYLGLVVGLLFSADPGVELVDIMNNS